MCSASFVFIGWLFYFFVVILLLLKKCFEFRCGVIGISFFRNKECISLFIVLNAKKALLQPCNSAFVYAR